MCVCSSADEGSGKLRLHPNKSDGASHDLFSRRHYIEATQKAFTNAEPRDVPNHRFISVFPSSEDVTNEVEIVRNEKWKDQYPQPRSCTMA